MGQRVLTRVERHLGGQPLLDCLQFSRQTVSFPIRVRRENRLLVAPATPPLPKAIVKRRSPVGRTEYMLVPGPLCRMGQQRRPFSVNGS